MVWNDEHPEWVKIAKNNHPKYDSLNLNVKKLMNRNAGIVLSSELLIALPNVNNSSGGGTSHGIRIANQLKIPVWNLTDNRLVEDLKIYMNFALK